MAPAEQDVAAERIIRTFFGTPASRQALTNAQAKPGSPEHFAFAKQCFAMAKGWEGDYAAMSNDVANAALQHFRTTQLHPSVVISVVRDITPFIVGSTWWAAFGYPVFNLTLDFFRAVRITDFGDAGSDPMYSPFPAYLIRFPEALKDGVRSGFLYPVPGVTGEETARKVEFKVTRFSLASPEGAEGRKDSRQAYTQWPEGLTFNHFLNAKARSVEQLDDVEREATELIGTEIDPDLTQQARRVLGNTLLYITANGGLPPKKQLGAEVPIEREHGTEPRFRVGRPIKLGPKIRAALAPGQHTGETWKLMQRFSVRGHWRNQAYGPEHSLRRKQWILPFYKGPEDITEAMQRTFEVE